MSVGVVLLAGYFGYSAILGEFGIFNRIKINDQIAELELELARLNAEISTMSNLTSRLSNDSIDLELLDERARTVLGYIRSDEYIIH